MGGAERQWVEELRAFRAAGIPVIGLTHRSIPPDLAAQLAIPESSVRLLLGTSALSRIASLRRWLRAAQPALINSHTSPELTYLATRGTGIPYVLYHNDPPFYGFYGDFPYPLALCHRRAYRTLAHNAPDFFEFAPPVAANARERLRIEGRAYLRAIAMSNAAAVVVLSGRSARELKCLYGIEASVVRGCVSDELLSYKPHFDVRAYHGIGAHPLLVSICRLDSLKRIDVILRAFKEVQTVEPKAILLIGGTGSEEEPLKGLAGQLNVSQSVIFTGYLDQNRVWDYFAAADVFVAPAAGDFNIAPYEALALRRKVVVSAELEIEPELDMSGWIFRAIPDASGVARAVLTALSSPRPRPLDLRNLTWSSRVRRLLVCYAAVVPNAVELRAASNPSR